MTGGDFTFPLPPDAEVSDLGLYVDGKLRHGVAIERVLARTARRRGLHQVAESPVVADRAPADRRRVTEDVAEFIAAGAMALRVCPDLVDLAAVRRGDPAAITEKARQYAAAVAAARG